MKDRRVNLFIYIGIFIGALVIGGNVIGYVFTGVITLASFVFIVESIPALKWLVAKTNALIDIGIFCFAIYAKIHFGVTIAMALLFAGIGYTLLYAPYIRDTYKQ